MWARSDSCCGGDATELAGEGNEKFASTKALSFASESGRAALNRVRICAGALLGTASANVFPSGKIAAVCTAINRLLKSTCGGSGFKVPVTARGWASRDRNSSPQSAPTALARMALRCRRRVGARLGLPPINAVGSSPWLAGEDAEPENPDIAERWHGQRQ